MDTRLIDEELASAKLLQHKLLPVLRHGQWFNPQQVTDTLERVPRTLRYQGRKRGQGERPDGMCTKLVGMQQVGQQGAQR